MLRHKHIDRICCLILALTLIITCAFMGAAAGGWVQADTSIGYENRLFDQSRVHTIEIVMDDWEAFLDTATSEEYAACTLVIDGESYKNVAIRGKGNTSLSSVASFGNDRYSFKVEFDHYQSGHTYHGLDKLSLNNLIYDNTYMKDYLAYTLMGKMGVAAPLCSFVQINVNGEPWGLYLAVEGVEDSFLKRNYGNDYGELYKPDSMDFGGGRGNGGGFDMDNFMENFQQDTGAAEETPNNNEETGPETGRNDDFAQSFGGSSGRASPPDAGNLAMPPDFDPAEMFGGEGGNERSFSFGGSGMGGEDVKLQYIDDDVSSYANIFESAKTNVTQEDQTRLIAALKKLSAGDTTAIDTQAVLAYLAVHNFLVNDDSYTGMMVHNYYLYEENGVMQMIPWDYNLAFGTMTGGSSATSAVNTAIDTLVTSGSADDRPMAGWVMESEEALARYHEIYQQFIDDVFTSGWFSEEIDRVAAMIRPYVENDPTAFCTIEEFDVGVATIKTFCEKRAQSVQGQLDGTIPATSEGQRSSDALIDAGEISTSDMGTMGGGMGGERFRPGSRSGDQTTVQRGGGNEGATPPEGFAGETPQKPEKQSGNDFAASFGGATATETPAAVPDEAPAKQTQEDSFGGSFASSGEEAAQNTPNPQEQPTVQPENPAASDQPAQEISRVRPTELGGSGQTQASSHSAWIWLGLCAVTLLAAIITAKCFKSNR